MMDFQTMISLTPHAKCMICMDSGRCNAMDIIGCTHCRTHELMWKPYYDEQRRIYLEKHR